MRDLSTNSTSLHLVPLALAAALLWPSSHASAGIITLGGVSVDDNGQFSSEPGATTVTFDLMAAGVQGFTQGIATYSGAEIFTCPCAGDGPLRDDVTKGAQASPGAPMTIDFAQPLGYFGFYWGSADPGNQVVLYNGASVLVTLTGGDLVTLGTGYGIAYGTYVNFLADPGESYTRVIFSSSDYPFETDNHAFSVAAVPEPASLLLFGTGAAALANRLRCRAGADLVARLRRRRRPQR